MPRFAQGPPHLVLTSHGSLDPRTCRTFLVSNRGRGKSLKNGSLRISQLTNKSTPTVTDASHGLHMPESQNDSDTPPHSNSQWYTTYDMFERKTCVKNKIIKDGESKHLNIARTPPWLKGRERCISKNATDRT